MRRVDSGLEGLGVEVEVVVHEGGDEEVGVVVALLHADGHGVPRRLRRLLQQLRLELLRQKVVRSALPVVRPSPN